MGGRPARSRAGFTKGGVATQALSRRIIGDGATDAIAGVDAQGRCIRRASAVLRIGPGSAPAAIGRTCADNPETRGFPVPIATQPDNRVVYFPACPTRMFGANPTEYDLLARAASDDRAARSAPGSR